MIFAVPQDEFALFGPDDAPVAASQLMLRALAGNPRASFTRGQGWSLNWRQPDRRLRQQHAVVQRARFVTPGRGRVEFRAGFHRLIWTPGVQMIPAEAPARREPMWCDSAPRSNQRLPHRTSLESTVF